MKLANFTYLAQNADSEYRIARIEATKEAKKDADSAYQLGREALRKAIHLEF